MIDGAIKNFAKYYSQVLDKARDAVEFNLFNPPAKPREEQEEDDENADKESGDKPRVTYKVPALEPNPLFPTPAAPDKEEPKLIWSTRPDYPTVFMSSFKAIKSYSRR